MIRWIANLIFVFVAIALAIFFLRIQTVDGAVSIRVRDARERDALWSSIIGKSRAPAEPQHIEPASQPEGTPEREIQPPAEDFQNSKAPASAGKPTQKPAEKDLDRKGLDSLIEKSL